MLKHTLQLNKYQNRDTTKKKHEEYQYLNLLQDILNEGSLEQGRNGYTQTVVGSVMHFSLENGKIPILTTKKTAWKTCLKELLWFIRGKMDNKLLNEQKVHIWDGNSSKEFKTQNGLENLEEGDLGPVYGHQWRFFNASYEGCGADYKNKGIDQLHKVIECLKDPKKRTSRRLLVSAWNPCQINEGVLPPCHVLFQFNVVNGNKLSCTLYQRSCDEFLGIPFNIASYSFLTHLIAHHCGLEAYEFIHYGGNCHVYDDHFDQIKEQISRTPYPFPKIEILNKHDNINDYVIDDFKIHDYQHHSPIKGTMRA